MPTTPGQGQSQDATEHKERGIIAACSVSLRIFAAKFRASPYRYFHFDINAGTGWNDEVNCIGSPVAFVRAAASQGIDRFNGHFCDIDADACRALLANSEVGADERCIVFHGDNRGLVPAIPDLIRAVRENPRYAIGTVLVDPNGCDVPIAELAELNRIAPRLDFIVNWNATAFKRNRMANGGVDLETAIKRLGKKHWLIRKPISAHQFALLVGRNMKVGEHRALGFYDLATDLGRSIFERLNYTKSEIAARSTPHPELFSEVQDV